MNSETVKFYDVGHVTHTIYKDNVQVGQTLYNCDNRRSPIRLFGKATREIVNLICHCFSNSAAEDSLKAAGFTKVNHTEWVR